MLSKSLLLMAFGQSLLVMASLFFDPPAGTVLPERSLFSSTLSMNTGSLFASALFAVFEVVVFAIVFDAFVTDFVVFTTVAVFLITGLGSSGDGGVISSTGT